MTSEELDARWPLSGNAGPVFAHVPAVRRTDVVSPARDIKGAWDYVDSLMATIIEFSAWRFNVMCHND